MGHDDALLPSLPAAVASGQPRAKVENDLHLRLTAYAVEAADEENLWQ
jgi:hypothetical protein